MPNCWLIRVVDPKYCSCAYTLTIVGLYKEFSVGDYVLLYLHSWGGIKPLCTSVITDIQYWQKLFERYTDIKLSSCKAIKDLSNEIAEIIGHYVNFGSVVNVACDEIPVFPKTSPVESTALPTTLGPKEVGNACQELVEKYLKNTFSSVFEVPTPYQAGFDFIVKAGKSGYWKDIYLVEAKSSGGQLSEVQEKVAYRVKSKPCDVVNNIICKYVNCNTYYINCPCRLYYQVCRCDCLNDIKRCVKCETIAEGKCS